MIPFNGFMQALTGPVPGSGEKSGTVGKNVHEMPADEDAMSLADDGTRSFLAWVRDSMDTAAADAGGKRGFNHQPSDQASDLSALDQLPAMIAEAMAPSLAGGDAAPAVKAAIRNDARAPLPQGIINAIIAQHERRCSDDSRTQDVLPDDSLMPAVQDNPPAIGATRTAAMDIPFQTVMPAIPGRNGKADAPPIQVDTPVIGQPHVAARVQPGQTVVPGVPGRNGQAAAPTIQTDTPVIGQAQGAAKEQSFQTVVSGTAVEAGKAGELPMEGEGSEKQMPRWLSPPAASVSDQGNTSANRSIEERWPSDARIPEQTVEPPTPRLSTLAGETRFTDQKAASQEDHTANFRSVDKHSQSQRFALADVNAAESATGQASDSPPSTAPDQVKAHLFLQDTAKAFAGDQSTRLADHPTLGQAAASTRTEESVVKTFQTTVMDQIVDKAALRSIHGRSEIQIRLKPEFLGNVQMNIAADKEQLVVRIMTDRPLVKEIIENNLHHLKTELQNQGLTIEKIEVVVNPHADQQHNRDQFAQMFRHHSSPNGRRPPHEQDPETLNPGSGNTADADQSNRDGINYFA